MEWPKKADREKFEIAGFIEAYSRLPGAPQLAEFSKSEKPDYIVREAISGREFGVELTSVYLDDRSVPDVHMRDEPGVTDIPYDKNLIAKYGDRLIAAIMEKICKARNGYDTTRPLILAIYVNEYIGIYLGKSELDTLVHQYSGLFDAMSPFVEVVFWNLGNGGAFRVRPA